MKKKKPSAPAPVVPPLSPWTTLAGACLWGTLFMALLVPASLLVLYLMDGPSPYGLALASLLSFALTVLMWCANLRPPQVGPAPGLWGWVSIGLFSLCSYRIVLWSVVHSSGEYRCLLSNNLGDSCLHMSLVNSVGLSANFDFRAPWLGTTPLSYPPGPDLIDAMLLSAGLPVPECMKLTGLILCLLSGMSLWFWGRAFGVSFFVLSGSLGGLLFLSGLGDNSYDPHWKNLFLTVFSPQRGMQLGLPLGLLILLTCRDVARTGKTLGLLLASVALALLPLTSVHSFVALCPVVVLTALFFPSRTAIGALLVGLALAAASSHLVGAWGRASSIRWEFFLGSDRAFDLWAWLVNFGVVAPLLIVSLFHALRILRGRLSSSPRTEALWEAWLMVGFFALFVASLFVALSPWAWDNTKIMLWVVVGASPMIWKYVFAPLTTVARTILLVAVLSPGLPFLADQLSVKNRGHGLFPSDEYNEGQAAKRSLPEVKLLAASPDYNHPWLVSGHHFLAGYEGWLWSHGLDFGSSSTALKKILRASPGWEDEAERAGVTHLLWGPREIRFSGRSSHPAQLSWTLVRKGKSGDLYSRH